MTEQTAPLPVYDYLALRALATSTTAHYSPASLAREAVDGTYRRPLENAVIRLLQRRLVQHEPPHPRPGGQPGRLRLTGAGRALLASIQGTAYKPARKRRRKPQPPAPPTFTYPDDDVAG